MPNLRDGNTQAEASRVGLKRKTTLIAAATNGAAFLLTLAAFWLWFPEPVSPAPAALDERLTLAAGLVMWPAGLILVMVVATAVSRIETAAFDPLRDREGRLYRINQRVLTNTVEQSAIFVPAVAAGAILFDAAWLAGLGLAVWFFCLGRLAFWVGYLVHSYARSPGMVVTVTANLVLIVGLLTTVLG